MAKQIVLLRVGVDAGCGGIQGPLFEDIKKLQAASALVASRHTEIQAVPVCLAFLLGTIQQTFQAVKE